MEYKKSGKQTEAPEASLSNEATTLWHISLMEMAKLYKQWDINNARVKGIHWKVGEVIAVDCHLVSVIENSGFKASYTCLLPNTAFLVESILLRWCYLILHKEYELKFRLSCKKARGYISFTTDIWSSDVNSDSLFGLTAHGWMETFKESLLFYKPIY